jgi:hypothetical protein
MFRIEYYLQIRGLSSKEEADKSSNELKRSQIEES